MDSILIAFYDDEPENNEAFTDWIKERPDCTLRSFTKIAPLFKAVLEENYRPHIAIVDLQGSGTENLENVKATINDAKNRGFDIYQCINEEFFADFNNANWLEKKFYGIAILSLFKLARCPIRVAHSQYLKEGEIVAISLYDSLATGAIKKEYNMQVSSLEKYIKEVQELLAVQRTVPEIYDIAVLEDVDESCDEGLVHQLRVRIGEKKK